MPDSDCAHGPHQSSLWYFLLLILIIVSASPAYADVGTPLMLATALHLIVGNAAIGVLEGMILSKVCGAPYKRCISLLVIANYVSMSVGIVIASFYDLVARHLLGHEAFFYSGSSLIPVYMVLSFLLTLLIESPFAWVALRVAAVSRFRRVATFVAVNVLSYALLVPFYSVSSAYSFYSTLTPDRAALRRDKTPVQIYYISRDDHRLCRISTTSFLEERISRTPLPLSGLFRAGLFLRENPGSTSWDLMLGEQRLKGMRYVTEDTLVIPSLVPLSRFGYPDMPEPLRRYTAPAEWRRQQEDQFLLARGRGQVVPPVDSPPHEIFYGTWGAEGVTLVDQSTRKRMNFAIEVPYRMWPASSPSLIPDNRLVYQLGSYIVLVDLDDMRVAYLAHGFSPLVVLASDTAV